MFLDNGLTSVNQQSDLVGGIYEQEIQALERPDGEVRGTFVLYTLSGSDTPSAADLMIATIGGAVRASDFVRLADRSWRDADGLRAKSLEMLLPRQVLGMNVVQRFVGQPIEVKHEQ